MGMTAEEAYTPGSPAKEAQKRSADGAPADEPGAKAAKVEPVGNVDFLVDHILKKCSDMQSAEKFFKYLRDNPTKEMKGRLFSATDVDEAEKRCSNTWNPDTAKESENTVK